MGDFFKNAQGTDGENIINSDDIVNNKPSRVDIRYDRKITTVTSAEKVGNYKVKVWPTLSDGEAEGVNALGMNRQMVERRRAQWRYEKLMASYKAEVESIIACHEILDEEASNDAEATGMTSITLEEVEKIRQDAYDEGKKQGYDDGYNEGLAAGREEGNKQGYDEGLAKGQEEGYANGLNQGKTEGYEKGQEEGLESGKNIVLEQVERFRFLADSLANPLREVDKTVTDEIAYMISRLVKVIVKKEIANNADYLKDTIEKALTILPDSQKGATIFLSPEDYDVIRVAIGADYVKSQNWDLRQDPQLEGGDLRVTNNSSEVNWKIDDRIDSLLNDFLTGVYPSVDSALRESIEGCPEYDELPKKPLSKRNLDDIAPAIKARTQSNEQKTPAAAEPSAEVEAAADNPAADVSAKTSSDAEVQSNPLTDDPAPYVDDFGHPVHQSKDGELYYFDENNERVYVDENGIPLDPEKRAELETMAAQAPQTEG